jgi:nitrogen fixation NifU-like protein
VSSLEGLYQQLILEHAKERHGAGLRSVAGAPAGESHQYNPLCGDEVTLRVALGPDRTVADVSWDGEGCSISQASTSVLYDLVVGRDVDSVKVVVDGFREMIRSRGEGEPDEDLLGDGVAFAGVGRHANRVKCAMLGWTALEDALLQSSSTQAQQQEEAR